MVGLLKSNFWGLFRRVVARSSLDADLVAVPVRNLIRASGLDRGADRATIRGQC